MNTPVPDTDDSGLFRREALEAKRPGQYGDIVLLPGASSRWTALAALTLVIALGFLLGMGTYTRRSTVAGVLAPSEGLIRVTPAQPGLIIERHATDGQLVRRGEVLFVVSGDRVGPDEINYQRRISEQVEARRRSLEDDLRRIDVAEVQEMAQLRRRTASLRSERNEVTQQGELAASRAKSAEDAYTRYQNLFSQGYVSRDDLLVRETEFAEARARMQVQQRETLVIGREITTTQQEIEAATSRYATQRAELQRAIMLASQEYTELEARRRVVVTAPADGKLTLVQADTGESVEPTQALALLVPGSSKLIARLYAPSRSVGFVKPGDTVLVRYDAFPYQQFGQHTGTVTSVAAAAVASKELRGLSLPPETAAETLFAITVQLPAQTMGAGPGALRLEAGMRVEADLLHETRRLYEWVLEPLYAARSRIGAG